MNADRTPFSVLFRVHPCPKRAVSRYGRESHKGPIELTRRGEPVAVIWFGCYRLAASAGRDELERYLQLVVAPSIPVLAYDERAAQWHADERARLAAIGKPPPFADGQIAAVAVTNGLILVTHHKSD